MPSLTHSPSDILRQLLVDVGQATDPADSLAWPVRATQEVDTPDNLITTYDTTVKIDGRSQIDGEVLEHYGIQVRVRCNVEKTGFTKARAISIAMDQVKLRTVVIGASEYLVWAITNRGNVLPLGKEIASSKRDLFTINALMSVRQTV